MSSRARHAKDLAAIVRRAIQSRRRRPPALKTLESLFEVLYFASLRTEESKQIQLHVVYIDPNNPDPKPPFRIVKDRWSYVRLASPIVLTESSIAKIAKASDPRTSSLAVYQDDDGKLSIWGLIDQQNRYYDFLNHDSSSGPERPGVFQIRVVGPGHLIADLEYEKVAELNVSRLLSRTIDVLNRGPIHQALLPGIQSYLKVIQQRVPPNVLADRDEWLSVFSTDWIQSVCRLLIRVQGLRHGGAAIIRPTGQNAGLNVKYDVKYSRLRTALEEHADLLARRTFSQDRIHELLEEHVDVIPAMLHLDETVYRSELDDNEGEIDGAIWFIALLTRVDGAVILSPTLDVEGFGAEITFNEAPAEVMLATNATGGLRSVDYNHFGTRHRSMMRYCACVPDSIGFVVSQDGDVRVISLQGKVVVIWENIRLRLDTLKHTP